MRILFNDDDKLKNSLINYFSRQYAFIANSPSQLRSKSINTFTGFIRRECRYIYFRDYGFPINFLLSSFELSYEQLYQICLNIFNDFDLNITATPIYRGHLGGPNGIIIDTQLPYKSYIQRNNYCAVQSLATMFNRLLVNHEIIIKDCFAHLREESLDHFATLRIHYELRTFSNDDFERLVYYAEGPIGSSFHEKYVDVLPVYQALFFPQYYMSRNSKTSILPSESEQSRSCFDMKWLLTFTSNHDQIEMYSSGIILSSVDPISVVSTHQSSIGSLLEGIFVCNRNTETFVAHLNRKFIVFRRSDGSSLDNSVKNDSIVGSCNIVQLPNVLTIFLDESVKPLSPQIDDVIMLCGKYFKLAAVCYYRESDHFICRTVETNGVVHQYDGMEELSIEIAGEIKFPYTFTSLNEWGKIRVFRAKLIFYVRTDLTEETSKCCWNIESASTWIFNKETYYSHNNDNRVDLTDDIDTFSNLSKKTRTIELSQVT